MRKDVLILAGTSLLGAILALHFWSQVRDDRKLIAALEQQMKQLSAARTADSVPLAAGPASQPVPVVPTSTSVPPQVAPVHPSPTVAVNASPVRVSTCEDMLAVQKRSAATTTAELSAELRLGPAESPRFAELLEAQAIAALPCASGGASTLSTEQLQAQLLALLGPGRFEQMQEFNAVSKNRQNMTTLRTQLSDIGAPLNDEQARQLAATLVEENRRSRREASSPVAPTEPHARLTYEEENLRLTEQRYERVLKAAQIYLSPEQLALLRGNLTRTASSVRDNVARMRASVEAGKGIPSAQPLLIMRDAVPVR
jgi:hypothetical protein